MAVNEWDRASEMAEKHASQSGVFVRLANNGDKVVGAFRGEPHAREVVWTGEKYETYDAEVHTDKKPNLRVMLNFYVPAEKAMKVIEGGTAWFKDVLKVRTKHGVENWLFEIERHGEAGDPKTTYSILPETQLDSTMLKEIAAAELHDLAGLARGEDRTGLDAPTERKPARKPGNGPIDPRTASELVARLKALPKADLDGFLQKFGVQRVRELKASDEAAARDYLDSLRPAKAAGGKDEVDPFG